MRMFLSSGLRYVCSSFAGAAAAAAVAAGAADDEDDDDEGGAGSGLAHEWKPLEQPWCVEIG